MRNNIDILYSVLNVYITFTYLLFQRKRYADNALSYFKAEFTRVNEYLK